MSVLFHFSLSLTNYEYRRRLTAQERSNSAPQSNDTEALIVNHPADEPSTSQIDPDDNKLVKPNVVIVDKKNFFKSPLLYQNALLYVFSRLFMTTSLVYMPLWLNERSYIPAPPANETTAQLALEGSRLDDIATIPLASFIASFVASMIFKQSARLIGHKVGYLLGSTISFCGCAWVAFAATPNSSAYELYIVAILFGAGSSITMIASLCITAELIGPHADQGGLIYSAVTFCDKLITGVAIIIIETMWVFVEQFIVRYLMTIQLYRKCKSHDDCPTYYRNVLAYACGAPTILGIVTLMTLICTKKSTERTRRVDNGGNQWTRISESDFKSEPEERKEGKTKAQFFIITTLWFHLWYFCLLISFFLNKIYISNM